MADHQAPSAPEAYDRLAGVYDDVVPDPVGFTDFYLGACGPEARSVLYVGCGTGRLLEQFVERGHDCVGVDPSEGMLDRARQRLQGADVHLVADSLPELSTISGTFERVVVAGGAFEYLMTTHDQLMALRRLRDLLSTDGLLLIDCSLPPFTTSRPEGNYLGDPVPSDSAWETSSGQLVSSSVTFGYDHFHQVVRSRCEFTFDDGETLGVEYSTRYTTVTEWRLLLSHVGLKARLYGGFGKETLTRHSSNIVIVGQR